MSVNIISRSAWGARAWNGNPSHVSLSQRTEFFIHYDGGTPITYTGVKVPQAIDRTHQNQGWAGIGYNFVVDQAGNIYEGRGWERQGAHCPNHNVSGIGVQIAIGGDQAPSDKALAAARALYDEACRKTGRTLAKKGHKDGFATACPGGKLYAWVKAGMPAPAGSTPAPSKPAPKPAPKPAAKVVDLSNVVAAAKRDPGLRQGGTTHAADVKIVEAALKAEGLLSAAYASDGSYGTTTIAAYRKWQQKLGYTGSDADGIPGLTSLKKLGAKRGFSVKA
ncbi:endolysin [Streptomyces phage Pablito]|uniref:Endolysin n=1 Tax=Streptomyces phage Pablito TaxID=2894593 RepID=A0AAE8YFB9_9CAUD|nr:endolysin [Streptomyces phage Pablito]UFD97964.1 putative endolysin [Streptomyces phage Pablito]